ncbi:DUF2797 domain-containing protein [Candidatus Micrarchaeota archaeon]|nr:DUF2797 domain-containing protein [Candidatus Micrarchaeota archaeon]
MLNHLISFHPNDLSILFRNNQNLEKKNLDGNLAFNFEKERMCIGYRNESGLHACPGREIGRKQCRACSFRDISKVFTRLNTVGFQSFYEEFKNQQFSIYLASFGHLVKCGVTRTERLSTRLKEQGADYFCEIARTQDADSAYSLERTIHKKFPVRGSVTVAQKMKLLHSDTQPTRLKECADLILDDGLTADSSRNLDFRKLEYTIPESFSEAENIRGKIYGVKGQILFFENEGKHYAINMSKKSGHLFQ